jgi:hypothetical protein
LTDFLTIDSNGPASLAGAFDAWAGNIRASSSNNAWATLARGGARASGALSPIGNVASLHMSASQTPRKYFSAGVCIAWLSRIIASHD